MMIKKKDNTQPGRRKEQRSSEYQLKRMVTILRRLNMDHLKVHLTSEMGKKIERN